MKNENDLLQKYLQKIQRFVVSDALNILVTTVTGWLSRSDLDVPSEKLNERLNMPDEKMQKLVQEGINFTSRTFKISFAAGMFKRRLSELVYSSPTRERRSTTKFDHLLSTELEIISSEIAKFAVSLPFEQGLEFLAELSKEWIVTCSEEAIRNDTIFAEDSFDITTENASDLILKWFISMFPY